MSKKTTVAVVIPIYETQPDPNEALVLRYFLKLYANYPIVFMTQADLDIAFYEQAVRESEHTQCAFERFNWKGYKQYIRLLVSADYYARFLEYDYILVAHLDAFAFDADLDHWCNLGYDYIGAVVYNETFVQEYIDSSRLLRILNQIGILRKHPVQNGGFSLRKVKSFYRNCRWFAPLIRYTDILYTEDLFWSMRLPLINPFFRVAPTKVAHRFAIELPSARSPNFEPFVSRLHNLPAGCHGWKVFGYLFWKAHMERVMQTELAEVEYDESRGSNQ
jgi:hypothetical protein